MYPDPNVPLWEIPPMGNPNISPIDLLFFYGLQSPRIPIREHQLNTMGTLLEVSPNYPLIHTWRKRREDAPENTFLKWLEFEDVWSLWLKQKRHADSYQLLKSLWSEFFETVPIHILYPSLCRVCMSVCTWFDIWLYAAICYIISRFCERQKNARVLFFSHSIIYLNWKDRAFECIWVL